MATFKVTKEMTEMKIRNAIKTKLIEECEKILIDKYGEKAVGMIRYGSIPKNELAFIVGSVEEDKVEYDIVATVNLSVKNWKHKEAKLRTVIAPDFELAKEDYKNYLTDRAAKQTKAKTENK